MQCHVRHNNVQFVLANNHVQVDDQVDLVGNVQDSLHDQVDLADNVQVLHHVLVDKVDLVDQDNALVVLVQVLHIVQVEIPAEEHQVQVDLIAQVDNVQDLAVAEILQVHSVRVDQRRVTLRRARKRYAMTLKICRRHHLVA
jgi:hypothetical protein